MSESPLELREVDRLPYIQAVETRLATIAQDPPVSLYVATPAGVPLIDGEHVQRYLVLYPSFGAPGLEDDLAMTTRAVEWPIQVSCFAHTALDCFALAQDADQLLHHWRPVVDGYDAGRLLPPEGYDPGFPAEDDTAKPSRWLLPLQYRTRLTRHH